MLKRTAGYGHPPQNLYYISNIIRVDEYFQTPHKSHSTISSSHSSFCLRLYLTITTSLRSYFTASPFIQGHEAFCVASGRLVHTAKNSPNIATILPAQYWVESLVEGYSGCGCVAYIRVCGSGMRGDMTSLILRVEHKRLCDMVSTKCTPQGALRIPTFEPTISTANALETGSISVKKTNARFEHISITVTSGCLTIEDYFKWSEKGRKGIVGL
jgi:hypothetical protein